MRTRPRQQMLELWRAAAGQPASPTLDSITDAERVLCLLLPAGEAGCPVGWLVGVLRDHYLRFSYDGVPRFPGAGYSTVDAVPAYAVAVPLALGTIGFARTAGVGWLAELAGQRLSAALYGLLRGFTINPYECGWSWGAPKAAPHVYFTSMVLDGLADLYAPTAWEQRLLTGAQLELAAALRLRFDMAQAYVTRADPTDDYVRLLVASAVVRDLQAGRGDAADLTRVGWLLADLSRRGTPSLVVPLEGSETYGPPLSIHATDFGSLLLKRVVQTADLTGDAMLRKELWDVAERVLRQGLRSWRDTLRAVESLRLADVIAPDERAGSGFPELATSLLAEAEHLLARPVDPARQPERDEIAANVTRAREILGTRPAGATTLLLDSVRRLEQLII